MRALLMCHNATIGQTDIRTAKKMERDDWLATVIHTSLFTDKRAEDDELPVGETDPRGYWGDSEKRSYGSLLWTLQREKITENLLDRVQAMTLDALNWLLVDNHVQSINVDVTRSSQSRIEILITVQRLGKFYSQTEVLNAA